MENLALTKFGNSSEYTSLIKLIFKPEFEKTSRELLERKIFTPVHLEAIEDQICMKAFLSFLSANIASSICHLTLFMNERNFTLEDVINIMGFDSNSFTTFLDTYISTLTTVTNFPNSQVLNATLQETDQELPSHNIMPEFTQIIKAVLLMDIYFTDSIINFENIVEKYDLSPSELSLYINFYVLDKSLFSSEEDCIASIKKYEVTLDQAKLLNNDNIKNYIKNTSDFEGVLKLISTTIKFVNQDHYNYLNHKTLSDVIKVKGIVKTLEILMKYDLTKEQFKILDQKVLLGFAISDFDDYLSSISKYSLSDNQIEILNTKTVKYPIYVKFTTTGGKPSVNLEDILKSVSAAPYLSNDQIKLLDTNGFSILAEKGVISLDKILLCASQHYLNDEQIKILNETSLDLSKFKNLKNISELNDYLTNVEKYNQPTKPWGAYVKEKLGYGEKIENVEPKTSAFTPKTEHIEPNSFAKEPIAIKVSTELVETIVPTQQE